MQDLVLCLNAGSSSLKFAVYGRQAGQEQRLLSGAAEGIGQEHGRFRLAGARSEDEQRPFENHAEAIRRTFEALAKGGTGEIAAAGHRIVHGGAELVRHQLLDGEALDQLRSVIPLAPLHMPPAIAVIEAMEVQYPGRPQVVCFDTAFHSAMPLAARRFALPERFWQRGIRRYGFHGLSYEYIRSCLGETIPPRTIIAHLGNGASLAALRDGKGIDTTMGLTPTGGFPMSTRSGDLDPGVLLYLLREEGLSVEELSRVVDLESGLAGISGISGDMKTLLDREPDHSQAALAIEIFCYSVRKFIGAMTAALGGLDLLVFTGGIGERARPIRARIVEPLGFLGIALDPKANGRDADPISSANSPVQVRVIPTNEDLMIARHTWALAPIGPRTEGSGH